MTLSPSRASPSWRLGRPPGTLARAPGAQLAPFPTLLGTQCGLRYEPRRALQDSPTDDHLPPSEPRIFDVEVSRYTCPGCYRRVEPDCPYPRNRPFRFALMSRVVHLRMLGLGVPKVVDCPREDHGVEVSPAAVRKMERSAAEALGTLNEGLREQVRTAQVVHGDETRFRVGGQNGWMWVFSHLKAVVCRIASGRGQDVVHEILDGFEGTLVRDAWDPCDCLTTAKHQLDLLHVNRWLERAEWVHRVEPRPLLKPVEAKLMSAGRLHEEFLRFADGVRRILRVEVHWSEDHPDVSPRLRRRVEWSARRSLTRLLNEPWRDSDAPRIAKELRHRRSQLFAFVTEPGVPWHNNEAETKIRQGVLFRKIRGGRQSWMGAWVLERLLTVYRTCRKRGIEFLDVVESALQRIGYPGFGVASGAPET